VLLRSEYSASPAFWSNAAADDQESSSTGHTKASIGQQK
jgi:hypothetical protein